MSAATPVGGTGARRSPPLESVGGDGSRAAGAPSPNNSRQALLERLAHRDAVLVRDDHALELRNRSALGAQIQRLHVDQRLL